MSTIGGLNKHGYLVLAATIMCQLLSRGQVYIASRLFVPIMETFKSSRAQTSMLSSVFVAVYMCTGVVSGLVVGRYGPKTVGVAAAIINSVATSVAFFATSIYHLIVLHGVCLGVAGSLFHLSCLSVARLTVERRYGNIAVAVVGITPTVTGMAYPYLLEYMLVNYGLRGTFLLAGGIAMHAVAFMMIWPMQPPTVTIDDIRRETKLESQPKVATNLNPTQNSVKLTFKSICNVRPFVLFTFGIAMACTSQRSVFMFITDWLREKRMASYLTSLSILVTCCFEVVSALLVGALKSNTGGISHSLSILTSVFGIVATLFILYGNTAALQLTGCIFNGFSLGLTGSGSISILALTMIETSHNAAGTGLIMTTIGLFSLILSPVNGYIKDVTTSYVLVFYASLAVTGVGGLCFLAAAILAKRL